MEVLLCISTIVILFFEFSMPERFLPDLRKSGWVKSHFPTLRHLWRAKRQSKLTHFDRCTMDNCGWGTKFCLCIGLPYFTAVYIFTVELFTEDMDGTEFVREKGSKMCSGQVIWVRCILQGAVYLSQRPQRCVSSTDHPAWIFQHALHLL